MSDYEMELLRKLGELTMVLIDTGQTAAAATTNEARNWIATAVAAATARSQESEADE